MTNPENFSEVRLNTFKNVSQRCCLKRYPLLYYFYSGMISFLKYHGTGNDFIIIDQMESQRDFPQQQAAFLCNRHFGIGADGIMLLQPSHQADFKMVYYNSDGLPGSMCGNGGRCLVHYAFTNGYIKRTTTFEAADGFHKARINEDGTVSLQMSAEGDIEVESGHVLLDTGSPHYVQFVENADNINLLEEGREVRYSNRFREKGVNVNFVEMLTDGMYVRTYERGVEDETLSCGTGVTAAVLAAHAGGKISTGTCEVITRGGRLSVTFDKENDLFTDIWLNGPAVFVYKGEIEI